MVHAQATHSMHIYEYKNDDGDEKDESRSAENIDRDTIMLGKISDNVEVAMNNYNSDVSHHQPTEQSFLPLSQQPTII